MDNSDSMACWSCECSRCIAARASTEWTPNSCLLYVGTSLCFSWYRTGINMIITDNWMSVHTMLPSEAAFCWNTWSFFFPLPSPTKHQKNTTNTCYNEWTTHELEWMELAHESWTGGWLRPADVGMNQNLAWIMQHLVISDVVWCGWCVGGLNLGHMRCLWCLPVVLICSDLHIFASLALDSSSLLPRELKDCRWRYRQKSANLDAQSTVELTMNMIKHGTQNNSTNHCATSRKNHWGNRLLKHLPKANSLQRMESAWNLPPGNAWGDRTPAGFLVVSPTRAVTRCH